LGDLQGRGGKGDESSQKLKGVSAFSGMSETKREGQVAKKNSRDLGGHAWGKKQDTSLENLPPCLYDSGLRFREQRAEAA